jgi:hypothetical protein
MARIDDRVRARNGDPMALNARRAVKFCNVVGRIEAKKFPGY